MRSFLPQKLSSSTVLYILKLVVMPVCKSCNLGMKETSAEDFRDLYMRSTHASIAWIHNEASLVSSYLSGCESGPMLPFLEHCDLQYVLTRQILRESTSNSNFTHCCS